MSEETTKTSEVSLFKLLNERRIPQIVGIYLGASWGLIQFIEWVVMRYGLSPYLPDFSLVILFSLLPSVSIVTYFHGRPGRDDWTRFELISIPVNVLFTVGLLFSIFAGKDLGAATTTLLLENEEGKTIERVIAKSEFRKKIVIFNLKNNTGDTSLDWLENGVPFAINIDHSQDPFITETHQLSNGQMYQLLKRSGFSDGVNLPITLMQKITHELHYEYFLKGDITKNGENFVITSSLYDADLGKVLGNNTFSSPQLLNVIDQVSRSMKSDLGIPDYHIDSIQDLPVEELLSLDKNAFKNLIKALEFNYYHNDFEQSSKHFSEAVNADPTFAIAHFFQSVILANSNHSAESIESIKMALKFEYKLPELIRFSAKDVFYIMTGQAEKRLSLLNMMVKLYPDTIDAHYGLAKIHENTQQYEKSILSLKKIQEIAVQPETYLDDIGNIYVKMNDLESALKYMKMYADNFPKEPKSFLNIARVYRLLGDDALVIENYEQALIFDANNITALLGLANTDVKLGHFESALNRYESLLIQFNDSVDKSRIYERLARFYLIIGQPKRSLEYIKLTEHESAKYRPPLNTAIQRLIHIENYIKAGEYDEAFEVLANVDIDLKPPFDKLSAIGYVFVYIELEDIENAEKYASMILDAVKSMASVLNGFQTLGKRIKASIAELKQDYTTSLKYYTEIAETESANTLRYFPVGRIYRKMGQYQFALEYLNKQLVLAPFSPKVHYEIALSYYELNEINKAIEHLTISNDIWQNAEPDFEKAKESKQLLEKLKKRVADKS